MKLPNKTITLISVSESSSPEMVTLSIHKKIVEHELTTVYICYHEGTHTLYCLKKCLIKPDILNQLIIEGKIGS